jgi:SNF2 family DNA or RNA helicase
MILIGKSNLTIANHIIFVAPYHTTGSNAQYLYDAAMTQAIGRARRSGQEKTVNVYHYLVTGTIDVDIIEFRRSQILKMVAPGEGELVSGDRKDSKLGSLCYEYVSREFY